MSASPNYRIIGLRIENVKRIQAVDIRPDGSAVIEITGRNGQGKSSILDAISYALGGKDVQPAKPVRDGQNEAVVVADLGDIIVERKWTANGNTYLSVRNKEGAKFGSPQQILDRLVGELTFDPLAFTRMDPKDQAKTLKKVAGLDFDEIDSLRAGAFQDRTDVNRDHKAAQARLAAMPEVDAPDEEIDFEALTAELRNANALVSANNSRRDDVVKIVRQHEWEVKSEAGMLDSALRLVMKLRSELNQAVADHDNLQKKILTNSESRNHAIRQAEAACKDLLDPDVTAIAQKVGDADDINRRVRQKQGRLALSAEVKKLHDRSLELTDKIMGYDQQKQTMLEQANLPVPGLAFGETGITLNSLPFDQACTSEQLRVGVAMGLALNPKLKVMLVRDGSLLDRQGRQVLADMAEAVGAQVWMERATDGEPIGVVIEDGNVTHTDLPQVAAVEE